jgi:hypothetical protein
MLCSVSASGAPVHTTSNNEVGTLQPIKEIAQAVKAEYPKVQK